MNHTVREIIEQCRVRWNISAVDSPDEWAVSELGHWQAAADTILTDCETNGIADVRAHDIPDLKCPECGCDDSDCVNDGFITIEHPDSDEIVYRYQCPDCSTYFVERFLRKSVEKC